MSQPDIVYKEGKKIDLSRALRAEYEVSHLTVPLGLIAWGFPIIFYLDTGQLKSAIVTFTILNAFVFVFLKMYEKCVVVYDDQKKTVIRKPFQAKRLSDDINNMIVRHQRE